MDFDPEELQADQTTALDLILDLAVAVWAAGEDSQDEVTIEVGEDRINGTFQLEADHEQTAAELPLGVMTEAGQLRLGRTD